jgi:uncharacterized protein (DUF2141 family)
MTHPSQARNSAHNSAHNIARAMSLCASTLGAAALAALTLLLPPAAQAQGTGQPAAAQSTTPSPTPASAGCVDVEVHNVRPQQGNLMLAAYGDAETFSKKPMAAIRVPAGDAITRLQLCGLSGTAIALTMFQDLDNNGKMNSNALGMPSEPWGSSGTPGVFGPSWDSGKVPLDGKAIVVKLSI